MTMNNVGRPTTPVATDAAVAATFTGNSAEAARARREKRPPVWNDL